MLNVLADITRFAGTGLCYFPVSIFESIVNTYTSEQKYDISYPSAETFIKIVACIVNSIGDQLNSIED